MTTEDHAAMVGLVEHCIDSINADNVRPGATRDEHGQIDVLMGHLACEGLIPHGLSCVLHMRHLTFVMLRLTEAPSQP